MRCRDGSYRWLSWTAVPEGDLLYCIARDVTEEKDAAEALRKTEDQLRQAQKMEAVGQLTGGIAHDFNNLLTGIVGSLDLMQSRIAQGRTESIGRYAEAAVQSANRAAALTHRLLAFARRQPLDPKPVDLRVLVGSLEDLLRRTLGEAIRLASTADPALWPTLCDPNQLESAVLNLVINARDAMPDGGLLSIGLSNVDARAPEAAAGAGLTAGRYVALAVRDTGTGMPPDILARALDPFFTTKPLGQGTGLGLSMIYGFAKQSDGHLRIDSEVGRGTAVTLFLPCYDGDVAAPQASPDRTLLGAAGRGETVLLVEDEPVVRDLIAEVLADLGYRTLQASDGPGGLEILRGGARIDLLVTDVGLPGLNGRQLADHARVLLPGVKVLFMTGYAETAALPSTFLETGMGLVTKPFSVDVLARRIREMMEA